MPYPVVPDVPASNVLSRPSVFVPIKALVVTAGTPQSVYTPPAGKRFCIVSYNLGVSASCSTIFEDGVGGLTQEVLRTGTIPVSGNGSTNAGDLGQGAPSATPGNALYLDVTASATLSGWIGLALL